MGWTAHFMRRHSDESATFDTFEDAVGFLYRQEWDGYLSSCSITAPDGGTAWSRDSGEDLAKLAERLGIED